MKVSDILSEGTWAFKRKQIPALIAELEKFKSKAYNIAGDDELFDNLDGALSRLKELSSL